MSSKTERNHTGLYDDFSSAEGWEEINPSGERVSPLVKMESLDGLLVVHHKFRTLEEAAEKWSWIESPHDTSTNLRKKYGPIDLDEYHYVVLNIKEKGASSYFDINGFTTKLGYTTGTTVIDLKDYNDERIKGVKMVDFGIDLQDNHTHLILDNLKFVSKLSNHEREKLIGPGLMIREENLNPRPYHGLEALKYRENIPLPTLDKEEMAIFRDDATGAITTRLTATLGDDYFGEGEIWSIDGAAIKFESNRESKGMYILIPGEGRVVQGPEDAGWHMWSKEDPNILYLMKRKGLDFSVHSWHKLTGKEELIAKFSTPEPISGYTEFKHFTPLGNIVIAFRETPHLYIIDVKNKKARHVELFTRLKDAAVEGDENIVTWANCYTYERWWLNIDTGERGLCPSFSSGHASHGPHGMVANFGGHLNVFIPGSIGKNFTPGDSISIWANWKNEIHTDYGRVTADNKYVFTNGRRGDVNRQHLMIPSDDPGAVLRVARYFTKFSWTSTTYSRPSPDYTKLIYNENSIGSNELYMVYTRRPDIPVNVKLEGDSITWDHPERSNEIAGYNIYGSNNSGLGFVRLNQDPVKVNHSKVIGQWKYYVVAAMEHSGLESLFSNEVSKTGAKSFYFEAEEMSLVPPARRFFDGYANGFQTVRINAESPKEAATTGKIIIKSDHLPAGKYTVWARVKGTGVWAVETSKVLIQANDWEWKQLGVVKLKGSNTVDIASSDDNLMLDMVLLTAEDFGPEASYPADSNPPDEVSNVKAEILANNIELSWESSDALDLHHYTIYSGNTADFECNNQTVIRSVLKTSFTDALPEIQQDNFYKIIAVDNRWNESKPVLIHVRKE